MSGGFTMTSAPVAGPMLRRLLVLRARRGTDYIFCTVPTYLLERCRVPAPLLAEVPFLRDLRLQRRVRAGDAAVDATSWVTLGWVEFEASLREEEVAALSSQF